MAEVKKGTLSLSRPADVKKSADSPIGKVRQSFSHGKSKVVTVEVKKKRFIRPAGKTAASQTQSSSELRQGDLTSAELQTRLKVVKDAIKENKEQEERLRQQKEADEKLRQELEAQRQSEEAERQEFDNEDDGSETSSSSSSSDSESSAAEFLPESDRAEKKVGKKSEKRSFSNNFVKIKETHSKIQPRRGLHSERYSDSSENEDNFVKTNNPQKKTLAVKKDIKELKGKYAASSGRISIYNALDDEGEERTRSLSSLRRARQKIRQNASKPQEEIKVVKEVVIPETIGVQELSNRMATRTGDVIKCLMKLGMMVTANQIIDADTAELVVTEFGHKVKRVSDSDVELILKKVDTEADLKPRPPVVTIMGHVDHGKTSLLDALRKTDVALNEAGGITQGIGAYQVTLKDNRKITFIDTPGHAAFTEMRSRGANVTDVVVLVVAADDSVKDQTVEAIHHAKAAKVPIIVAINKMDKPGANPDKVRKDLMNYEVFVESYGGDVMDIEISAKSGLNLDKLEEAILLQAEMLELKANPDRTAEGVVIESKVEKGLGSVATVLVNKGTLRVGDVFVSGTVFGKVRGIRNDCREALPELTPGMPGEIIGFNGTTIPGDDFVVVEDEAKAREIANYRDRKKREQSWVVSSRTTVEQMFSKLASDEKLQVLSVILKADVQGSSEAISSSLQKLSNDEVAIKIIHSGVGEITESDVVLAKASQAMILGFNVRANMQARDQISRDRIQVKYYSVIYDLIDDMKALLSGMLAPDEKEKVIGSAEVRKVFDISRYGRIAGCMVLDGVVRRGAKLRLIRDGIVVHTGAVKSVRHEKDDVKEVRAGFECGICLENYNDIHLKDVIECYEIEEIARKL
ncbi:MAG: translation initiation factor IF-2 [Alphaproteobacteria bacterium]|nr:translation initiation factor IF-2 [Alphaproteobacteria bacterium]